MDWITTSGRTLHEAKSNALDQLGIVADEAEFDVVNDVEKGLFGRVKNDARIRARVKPRQIPRRTSAVTAVVTQVRKVVAVEARIRAAAMETIRATQTARATMAKVGEGPRAKRAAGSAITQSPMVVLRRRSRTTSPRINRARSLEIAITETATAVVQVQQQQLPQQPQRKRRRQWKPKSVEKTKSGLLRSFSTASSAPLR